MRPSSVCLLLAVAFLLHHHHHVDANSVEETCKAAAGGDPNVHFDFCVKSLRADPRSGSADTKGLAVIAASLSSANATGIESKVKSLLQKATDEKAKQSLDTCLSVYDGLVSGLADSISAIKDHRLADAMTYLSASVGAPDDCENAFKEMQVPSPLSKENGDEEQLCVIALAITSMLR